MDRVWLSEDAAETGKSSCCTDVDLPFAADCLRSLCIRCHFPRACMRLHPWPLALPVMSSVVLSEPNKNNFNMARLNTSILLLMLFWPAVWRLYRNWLSNHQDTLLPRNLHVRPVEKEIHAGESNSCNVWLLALAIIAKMEHCTSVASRISRVHQLVDMFIHLGWVWQGFGSSLHALQRTWNMWPSTRFLAMYLQWRVSS